MEQVSHHQDGYQRSKQQCCGYHPLLELLGELRSLKPVRQENKTQEQFYRQHDNQ